MRKTTLVIILVIGILTFAACKEKNVYTGYDEATVNDGKFTVEYSADMKGTNYSYPALENLIESIEDSERKELVLSIISTPTSVEFSATNEIIKEYDKETSIRQMYIESFDKTVELIKLPIEDLREKRREVALQAAQLEIREYFLSIEDEAT